MKARRNTKSAVSEQRLLFSVFWWRLEPLGPNLLHYPPQVLDLHPEPQHVRRRDRSPWSKRVPARCRTCLRANIGRRGHRRRGLVRSGWGYLPTTFLRGQVWRRRHGSAFVRFHISRSDPCKACRGVRVRVNGHVVRAGVLIVRCNRRMAWGALYHFGLICCLVLTPAPLEENDGDRHDDAEDGHTTDYATDDCTDVGTRSRGAAGLAAG